MNEMPLVRVSGVYAGHLEHHALVQSVVHNPPWSRLRQSVAVAWLTARLAFCFNAYPIF